MRETLAIVLGVAALSLVPGCGGAAGISEGPMPQGGSFTGVWHSPQYGEMHMIQTGNNVVGTYSKDERTGRVQGTVRGNVMRFEWSEERELVAGRPMVTRGRGYFRYAIGEDTDHYITGEWGHDSATTGGGPWNAVRDRRREPTIANESDSGSGGDNFEEFDTASGGDSGGGAESESDDLGDL